MTHNGESETTFDFQELVRTTLKTYFRAWTEGEQQWKFLREEHKTKSFVGYCESKKKVILVPDRGQGKTDTQRILIHEICHALTTERHTKGWKSRMSMAADHANTLNDQNLAKALWMDLADVEDGIDLETKAGIYDHASDIAASTLVNKGNYGDFLKTVAADLKEDESQLEKSYPRLKAIWKDSQRLQRMIGPRNSEPR